MPITLENVGITVRDLEATVAFFTDLGLTVVGRDTVSGEWADTAVGLDGNQTKIAMLQTPDGPGRLELFEYIHPEAIDEATRLLINHGHEAVYGTPAAGTAHSPSLDQISPTSSSRSSPATSTSAKPSPSRTRDRRSSGGAEFSVWRRP